MDQSKCSLENDDVMHVWCQFGKRKTISSQSRKQWRSCRRGLSRATAEVRCRSVSDAAEITLCARPASWHVPTHVLDRCHTHLSRAVSGIQLCLDWSDAEVMRDLCHRDSVICINGIDSKCFEKLILMRSTSTSECHPRIMCFGQ